MSAGQVLHNAELVPTDQSNFYTYYTNKLLHDRKWWQCTAMQFSTGPKSWSLHGKPGQVKIGSLMVCRLLMFRLGEVVFE